jgi:predicted nucleic acid-binding protein
LIRPRAVNPRRVFVDTSAYYALVDADAVDYRRTLAAAAQLTADRRRLFTSNFVMAEVHALLLNRIGRAVALRALHEIEHGEATVVRVSLRDERRARSIIAQYSDKDFSLTDAMSFAVMERLGIGAAFTLDDHFAQYGFISIP